MIFYFTEKRTGFDATVYMLHFNSMVDVVWFSEWPSELKTVLLNILSILGTTSSNECMKLLRKFAFSEIMHQYTIR